MPTPAAAFPSSPAGDPAHEYGEDAVKIAQRSEILVNDSLWS